MKIHERIIVQFLVHVELNWTHWNQNVTAWQVHPEKRILTKYVD
jgi:hypothetical protein